MKICTWLAFSKLGSETGLLSLVTSLKRQASATAWRDGLTGKQPGGGGESHPSLYREKHLNKNAAEFCSPSQGVPLRRVKPGRDDEEVRRELAGDGQHDVVKGRQVVAVPQPPTRPRHVHREALPLGLADLTRTTRPREEVAPGDWRWS